MSLFRASNAPADNHHDTSWTLPGYDGPTERLAEPPGKELGESKSRAPVFAAIMFSSLALVASAGAATMAWQASRDQPENPAAAAITLPTTAAAPAEPDESAGGYRVSYAQEPLKMQVGCAASMYVDLDEPRANAEPGRADLRYDSRCGGKTKPTLSLGPGATGGSQVETSDMDAAGCDRAIRTSPLGAGADVPAVEGTVLCVQTAATEGDRSRMALVEVTDVAVDGTAGLRATSWTVP